MSLLTSEEIEKAARECATFKLKRPVIAWVLQDVRDAFKEGAEFAQKAILEKCASGFDEFIYTFNKGHICNNLDCICPRPGLQKTWQASRIQAEKEIADLREKIYQCGLACECTTCCDCYIKKFNNLEKEIAELKKRLDEAEKLLKPFTQFKLYEDYDFKSDQTKNYYAQPCVFKLAEFENHAREAREYLSKK